MAVHTEALEYAHHGPMTDEEYVEQRDLRFLGFLMFLFTDSIFFTAYIFAYLYLRSAAPVWPPVGIERPDVNLGAANAIALFGSGITAHYAMTRLKENRLSGYIWFTIATIILGILFLLGQVYEYHAFYHEGVTWAGSTFGASFFTLTGLHGFHVFVGVWFLIATFAQTLAGKYSPSRHFGLTAATLYWHFVDVIWVVLFFLFYIY
ncbi:MAG: heme-copper oxidase subunit III [bacterium]|nr:heme-copper oxidase subunit III [bacterium]